MARRVPGGIAFFVALVDDRGLHRARVLSRTAGGRCSGASASRSCSVRSASIAIYGIGLRRYILGIIVVVTSVDRVLRERVRRRGGRQRATRLAFALIIFLDRRAAHLPVGRCGARCRSRSSRSSPT